VNAFGETFFTATIAKANYTSGKTFFAGSEDGTASAASLDTHIPERRG
jgi:hypothetical protein